MRRKWTARQELEASAHGGRALFVTLTFSPLALPESEAAVRSALQGFVKRLRRWIEYHASPEDLAKVSLTPAMVAGLAAGQFRFLGAVERGSRGTRRLHGHLNLFGLAMSFRFGGFTMRELIEKSWRGQGFVKVKPFRHGAARYVAKYLLKCPGGRMMSKGGRSGLGGLGALAVPALAAAHDAAAVDVERKVMLPGARFVFLDRYLSDRLRRAVGFSAERIAELASERLRELVARSRELRWRELHAELIGPVGPSPGAFRRYWLQ